MIFLAKLGQRWLYKNSFVCEIISDGIYRVGKIIYPEFRIMQSLQRIYRVGEMQTTNVGANDSWVLLKNQDSI